MLFLQDIPYEIDDDLEVIATPGLFPHVVSVMCRDTPVGVVAIAGKYILWFIQLCA